MLRQLFKDETITPVDELINKVLAEMNRKGVLSEDYPTLLRYLERLYEVKAEERQDPVSHDTIALIVGNLLGILLIVAYEQKHVMTSKGFTQLIRPK